LRSPRIGGRPTDRLVTARDLAELLGVSVDWVYDRARYQGLPKYERGRVLRFSYPEVLAWMRGEEGPRVPATVTDLPAGSR
jgi:excisionase family DNA binding protein